MAVAARDAAYGMRSSLLFLHPAHHFFFPSRFRRKFVYFRGDVLRDNVPSLSDSITYVPFLLPAMCPLDKFQKLYNHSRLCGDGERANIRFSGLPTFPSFLRLYLIFYGSLPFVSLSIFLRCLSLRELFNRLFPIFCLYFLFFFLFLVSLRTKAKRYATKANNCSVLLFPHNNLFFFLTIMTFFASNYEEYSSLHSYLCNISIVTFRRFTFSFTSSFLSQFRLYRSRFVVKFLFIFKRHYYSLELAM